MQVVEPTSLADLVAVLSDEMVDAKIIAGGTAVVLMMQQGLIAPERLVSVAKISDLRGITETDGHIRIGAMATLRDVAHSQVIADTFPALARACSDVGNVRIRNAATLGGNLAEADYASDPPSVLCALGATVDIVGPNGSRQSSVADLLTGFYSTTLEPAEVITAIGLPKPTGTTKQVYLKYRSRSSEDRPCVGVAAYALLSEDNETIEDLTIAVGAAASTPQVFPEIAREAQGTRLDPTTMKRIADGYAEAIEPMEDLRGSSWYRRQMTRVFVTRALEQFVSTGGAA